MKVARKHALTCFYDGKLYVMGGCLDDDEPWAEVFDTNIKTWEPLSDPGTEIRNIHRFDFYTIKEIKGKIYLWSTYRTYAYDTRQDNWENIAQFQEEPTCLIDGGVRYYYIPKSACVIDGVWYYYSSHGPYLCRWTKDGKNWKGVEGLASFEKMHNRNGGSTENKTKLVSCGGKLLLIWEGYMEPSYRMKIWCAEIKLEKYDKGEIWENVDWIDVVQSVRTQCELLHCLVVPI